MRRDHLTPAQKAGYGWTPHGMSYGLGVRIIIDPAQMNTTAGYTSFGWDGAAGSFASVDPEREISIFYAQHLFGSSDYFINSTIRNIVYSFAD
jgi:CubicO group peptidase (beta-lactamase class C family)